MSRPDVVRIGPLRYRVLTEVEKIKAASDSADISADAEWVAFSDHDKQIIAINGENPDDAQQRDLLHEIIHCCLRFAGVEPNAYAEVVAEARGKHGGYTVEEFMVAATSGPLLGVLIDNPALVKWLTKGGS